MDTALLHTAWQLAEDVFRPCAAAADQGTQTGVIGENIRLLARHGFFGLGISTQYGGLDADEATRQEYAEILASACGVTAFTQQQLQTGVKFVAEADNAARKRELLPALAAGRLLYGIALSHLRRSGPPALTAVPVPGGYKVNGCIPWITGWSLLDGFVLGVATEDGTQHLFASVDRHAAGAALEASAPMPLVVMEASDTVEVAVRDLFIPDSDILSLRPAAALERTDTQMLTAHAALPLGCTRAAVRVLRELSQQPGREAVSQTAFALNYEADQLRREALTWNCDCVDHPQYRGVALRVRAASMVLALRAAQASVTASGGRAHLKTAAPQRLLREAQFYLTAVQTAELREATLEQLVSPLYGL